MIRVPSLLAGLAALALLATGCGSQPHGDPGFQGSPSPTLSGDPAEVAIQITTESAWESPHVSGAPVFPDLVIYADGTFYGRTGSDRSDYHTGTLNDDYLAELVDRADDLLGRDYGVPGLDGFTTTLTVESAAGAQHRGTVDVWVPTEVDGYDGEARESRELFGRYLSEIDSLLAGSEEWQPTEWLLLSEVKHDDGDRRRRPAWPLDDPVPAATEQDDPACQVVTPGQARRIERVRARGLRGARLADR